MRKQRMLLNEDIVKYIFSGMNVEIAPCDGGCIVGGFKRFYPANLGIFIPYKVNRSNYSSYFPESFEEYFWNIHQEAEYISRYWEGKFTPNLPDIWAECISGKIITQDNNSVVFRFDELLDPREKTDALCRVKLGDLSDEDKISILDLDPTYTGEAWDLDDSPYQYFITPITHLFRVNDELLAAIIAFTNSVRMKNGPI
ncbi:MAG: hypothetical protein Q4F58_03405 [Candidatus Saccharibacteria bacterium]|nr:hypothetical protein [Candidatus Saccharibacteria bacterium]